MKKITTKEIEELKGNREREAMLDLRRNEEACDR